MRWLFVGLLVACGGSSGGNPDAAPSDTPRPVDAAASCPAVTAYAPTARDVVVTGDSPAAGIFDPSLVYPAGAPAGAMAYSAVPDQMTIRTHVAVSSDGGATWTYVAEANAPETNVTIAWSDASECPGGSCTGNLISEVPSLIYDADDPDTSRRWKLFAHRYLVGAGVALHYRIGTIALQTASAPDAAWSPPAKWLGWTSAGGAYSSSGVQQNVSTLPGLADCLALTEPGAIWYPGTIDLALGCVYLDAGTPKIRVELLRSTDHAATFTHVSTLLRPEDAACLTQGASINAPDLFVSGTTEYVVATPAGTTGYTGCLTFPFDDIAAGHVQRDAMGRAIVTRAIAPTSGQFSGACTFADGAGGYLTDLGFLGAAKPFHVAQPAIAAP